MTSPPEKIRPPEAQPGNLRMETFAGQLRDFARRNLNWILLAALAVLILQDVFGMHGVLAMRRAQHEAVREQVEIDRIDQENVELQRRVKSLKTDPGTIERIAREQMGLARPGEYIFKVPPKSDGSNTSKASDQPAASAKRR